MRSLRKMVTAVAVTPLAAVFLTGCGGNTVSSDDAQDSVDRAVAAVKLAEQEVGGTAFELDEEGTSGWDSMWSQTTRSPRFG